MVFLALLLPASAGAATVTVSGSELRYDAVAGEVNVVTVDRIAESYRVVDRSAGLSSGPGCVSAGPSTVLCTTTNVETAVLRLGDGADTATVALTINDVPTIGSSIDGGPGNDQLTSGWYDGQLTGGDGDDVLIGNEGHDTLDGGTGADTLRGGPGKDRVDYSARDQRVSVTLDSAADDGADGERDLVAEDIEEVFGGSGPDVIRDARVQIGGAGDDRLTGGESVRGGDGDDALIAGSGHDPEDPFAWGYAILEGGPGDDVLTGGANGDELCGDVWNAFFHAHGYPACQGSGADRLDGGGGDDLLVGGGGTDAFAGGAGRDRISYNDGDHASVEVTLDGVADDGSPGERENVTGFEVVEGTGAGDLLVGSAGDELLIGDFGADRIEGGAGDDRFQAGPGDDTFFGGAGVDTVDYDQRTGSCTCNYDVLDGVRVTLDGNAGDGAYGESDNVHADVENVLGSLGPDHLVGSDSGNWLSGGGAADTLEGGAGADVLRGGGANDVLLSHDDVADTVDCDAHDGRGSSEPTGDDRAEADTLDLLTGCEVAQRNAPLERRTDPETPQDETSGTSTVQLRPEPAAGRLPPPVLPAGAPPPRPPSMRGTPVDPRARLHILSVRVRGGLVTARVRCVSDRSCKSLLRVVAPRRGALATRRVSIVLGATRTIELRVGGRRLPRGARLVATVTGGTETARTLRR
jgi:Ca2+-binding RTX toxin-like protein